MDNISAKIETLIIYEITGKITEEQLNALNTLRDQSPEVMELSVYLHEKLGKLPIPAPKDINTIIGPVTEEKKPEYADVFEIHKKTYLKPMLLAAVAACAAAIIIVSLLNPDRTKDTFMAALTGGDKTTGIGNRKPITLSLPTKKTINGDSLKVNENGRITTNEGVVFNTTGPVIDTASIYVPAGGRYKLKLSDGTSITLNAKSTVTFFRKFDQVRTIRVQGEAYVEVAPDDRKPFVVYAGDTKTEVLGTSFNVNSDHTGKVIVSLTKGKVNVLANGKRVSILPGKSATYAKGAITVGAFDQDSLAGWRNGEIYMQCKSSQEVEDAVAQYLSINIKFERPLVQQAYIKIKFNEPASEFLEQFASEYTIDSVNNIYYLK